MNMILLALFLLTGCSTRVINIGFKPEKNLQGNNIKNCSEKHMIIKIKENSKEKLFLVWIKYQVHKLAGTSKVLDKQIYELITDQNGKIIKMKSVNSDIKHNKFTSNLPKQPNRASLIKQLFADVASVSVF